MKNFFQSLFIAILVFGCSGLVLGLSVKYIQDRPQQAIVSITVIVIGTIFLAIWQHYSKVLKHREIEKIEKKFQASREQVLLVNESETGRAGFYDSFHTEFKIGFAEFLVLATREITGTSINYYYNDILVTRNLFTMEHEAYRLI